MADLGWLQDSDASSEGRSGRRHLAPSIEWTDGEPPYDLELLKLTTSSSLRKESLCSVCEKSGPPLMACCGPCQSSYHAACLGLTSPPNGEFKCDECTTGKNGFAVIPVSPRISQSFVHPQVIIHALYARRLVETPKSAPRLAVESSTTLSVYARTN